MHVITIDDATGAIRIMPPGPSPWAHLDDGDGVTWSEVTVRPVGGEMMTVAIPDASDEVRERRRTLFAMRRRFHSDMRRHGFI